MITLSRDRSELSMVISQCRCEVCKSLIVSGDYFYAVDVKEGHALITKLYHFNCTQRTSEPMSPEAKDRQEKLNSLIAEREAAEEELEESEQRLSDLIAEESQLRRKLLQEQSVT